MHLSRPTVRVAVPAPPWTTACPRTFLILTETRVFPPYCALERFETHPRCRLAQKFNTSAFECPSNFFDCLEMRSDGTVKSLKTPNGRDCYAGVGG